MTAMVGNGLLTLDLDIECRPLSWYGGDWVTKEVTAIAWKFLTGRMSKPMCVILGEDALADTVSHLDDLRSMLTCFRCAYDVADMVTGHFIRGFDLPVLNGAMMEVGLPLLSDKLAHDTKLDMVKGSGLSKSQENLGAMLGLRHPKVGMNQASWREANRLTPEGMALTRKRVTGDVLQHIELRKRMLDVGMLGPPKLWTPQPSGTGKYAP